MPDSQLLDLRVDLVVADPWSAGREMLCSVLRRGGHSVDSAEDGAAAVRLVRARNPDLVLADVHLAEADDWDLLRRIRAYSSVAIVVVIGPDVEHTKIRALSRGADDYFTKPVPASEMIARVGAHLRLLRRLGGAQRAEDEVFDDGPLQIHTGLRQVEIGGRPVELTPLEYRLLLSLVRHRNSVLSRDQLQEMAWHGCPDGGSDHVKLYVHYLRRKLAAYTDADPIRTVRGHGYQWVGISAATADDQARELHSVRG